MTDEQPGDDFSIHKSTPPVCGKDFCEQCGCCMSCFDCSPEGCACFDDEYRKSLYPEDPA